MKSRVLFAGIQFNIIPNNRYLFIYKSEKIGDMGWLHIIGAYKGSVREKGMGA